MEDHSVSNDNVCRVAADGPLHISGRLRIVLSGGSVITTTEAFLCRCGLSRDKPFCDDSHCNSDFADPGTIQGGRLLSVERGLGRGGEDAGADRDRSDRGGSVTITCAVNGPLLVRGPLAVVGEDDQVLRGEKGALCRCGASSTKPFCDGSHRSCGFSAE